MSAYQGVMQAQFAAQQQGARPASRTAVSPGDGTDLNPGTRATLQADPAFAGLVSFG